MAIRRRGWVLAVAGAPAVLVLVVTLLAVACDGPQVVATIGERTITRRDVAYRRGVMRVRSGEGKPAHLALFGLVREALMAEVARRHGVVVTEAMLAEEAARVQEQSRDPRALARIRVVFGGNEAAYRRLVLEPTLVNQMLHARFSLDHDIQAEPLARATEVLAAVRSDAMSMTHAAEAFGGERRELQFVDGRIRRGGEDLPEVAPELAAYGLEPPGGDTELVERVVRHLEPGELHPKIVEDRRTFMVVRLVSRDGDDAVLEAVVIPKLRFDPWFWSKSQNVPIAVTDLELRNALLTEIDVPFITERLADGT